MLKLLFALLGDKVLGNVVGRLTGEAHSLVSGLQSRIRIMLAAVASLIIAAMATLGALLLSLITFVLNPGGEVLQRLLIADSILIALTLGFGIAAASLLQKVRHNR